ncbi:MAG: sigma-54-dependent transcriptional regulator [Mariniblastus sp.]
MPTILAVDDDRSVLQLIDASLIETSTVLTAENGADSLSIIEKSSPDAILLDINLPETSGLELIEKIHSIDARIPIVFMTVSDSSDVAIEAIQRGAFDFLTKPLDIETIQDVVERALETRKMQIPVAVQPETEIPTQQDSDSDLMIGKSPKMLEVYKEIGRVASKDVTVLICGESGTGKELVARAIYQHSDRKEKPFLAVNCAALTETLLESELFGHEKGAFTGAEEKRIGKFEQCSGGTIFLDEVGDMSPVLQSKVLRLLQEQKFERVGGRETIETDVRIISATNRDLESMIAENDFRLDLYHRLNSYRINLPPLREREKDIELLVQYFLKRIASKFDIENQGISPEAMRRLREFTWPGNVRQLQSVLRRALLKSTSPVLVPSALPDQLGEDQAISLAAKTGTPMESLNGTQASTVTSTATFEPANASFDFASRGSAKAPSDLQPFLDRLREADTRDLYQETQEFMERYLLSRILKENQGNQSKTADELGISRGRLRNKIRALGISIEQIVEL